MKLSMQYIQIFHSDLIPLRWQKQSFFSNTTTVDSSSTQKLVKISYDRVSKSKPMQTNQVKPAVADRVLSNKYTSSLRLCQEFSQSICRGSDEEFNERIEVLKILTSMWNDGLKVELKPIKLDSSAKSSPNTSLDISTMPTEQEELFETITEAEPDTEILSEPNKTQLIDNCLPSTSELHNDQERTKQAKINN